MSKKLRLKKQQVKKQLQKKLLKRLTTNMAKMHHYDLLQTSPFTKSVGTLMNADKLPWRLKIKLTKLAKLMGAKGEELSASLNIIRLEYFESDQKDAKLREGKSQDDFAKDQTELINAEFEIAIEPILLSEIASIDCVTPGMLNALSAILKEDIEE